jgi:hypothetical protein
MGLSHEHIVNPATAALIRRKARRIVQCCGLNFSDYPDLQQDLFFHLIHRAPSFEIERGDPRVFVAIVIRCGVADLVRRHFERCHGALHCASLGDEDHDVVDPNPVDLGLRLDVHAVLNVMDPQCRALAEALTTHKLARAGRSCGLTRGQARQRLAELRRHFTICGLAPDTSEPLRKAS